MTGFRRKPKRSLRTLLVIWFLLFSIVPLAFVSIYSINKFEKAIDRELSQRLSGNAREVSGILSDYYSGLQQKRDRYIRDPRLVYDVTMGDFESLKAQLQFWLRQDFVSSLAIFNREGRMILTSYKDDRGGMRTFRPSQEAVFLSEKYMSSLKEKKEIGLVEYTDGKMATLIVISKIQNTSGRVVGYFEQTIDLNRNFLQKLKSRMKLDFMILRENGGFVIGSHQDFSLYKKDFFQNYVKPKDESFFELKVRGLPVGFLVYPITWDQSTFYVALGASKGEAKSVLKNVNYAFFTVVGAIAIFLLITVMISSSWILQPLYELVEALQSFETQDQAITIPVKNDTEIGLLTESFNEMSQKISQARNDLRKKIFELEEANKELKETQTKLVHSAKMISLGQLVAGVAHELNNPIGFIYSNMTHLREYSEKLIELVQIAENRPQKLAKAKEDAEFDFIVRDLPKLISSCEDGARRTRDIVLGLRNFSRLEEIKLTEVDIRNCLDTTLNLLQGELKSRIQVHKNYESIPLVYCYVTQINQVLMNILSNAVQAIEGNGEIWISTQTVKKGKDDSGWVQISIQDSGRGMPAEVVEKIFDPFYTTKGVGQGTGLGLSISYGIIQNHGGEIQVRSQSGVGTEFVIVIPVKPPAKNLS